MAKFNPQEKELDDKDIKHLVESYKLGAKISGKIQDNDEMLDFITWAKKVRRFNNFLNLVLTLNAPIYFDSQIIRMVVDKAESLKDKEIKMEVSQ